MATASAQPAAPATLLALAFDPAVSPPADEVSERILDAALDLAAASGVDNLTMDDVARRAGVGRMTIYRRFGDKRRLVEALGVRETRRSLAGIAAALDPDAPIEERIADGFVAALGVATKHPLLVRVSRFEPEVLLDAMRSSTEPTNPLADTLREFVAAFGHEAQQRGELEGVDIDATAELLVRIGVSFVLMPRSVIDYTEESTARELARTLLAPMVSQQPTVSTGP